jgi:hypothetical protein
MTICTLTGTVLDAQGAALASAVLKFTPAVVPISGSGTVITMSIPTVTTGTGGTAGQFSIALEDNTYSVQITAAGSNNTTTFNITIPPGTANGTIDQFMSNSAPPSGFSQISYGTATRLDPTKGLQIYDATTGLWHAVLVVGNPPQLALDAGSTP